MDIDFHSTKISQSIHFVYLKIKFIIGFIMGKISLEPDLHEKWLQVDRIFLLEIT